MAGKKASNPQPNHKRPLPPPKPPKPIEIENVYAEIIEIIRSIFKMATDPKSTHYDAGGIETIDVIKAKLTPEQFEGYLLGNAIKYTCRANFKGSKSRDLEKAKIYLDMHKRHPNQESSQI